MSPRLALVSLSFLSLAALPAQAQTAKTKPRRSFAFREGEAVRRIIYVPEEKALRIVELEPKDLELTPARLARLFRQLRIDADVIALDGQRHEHPDRALLTALKDLAAKGRGREALGRCAELLRFKSRMVVFKDLAGQAKLDAKDRAALVAAACGSPQESALFAQAPHGLAPGGGESGTRKDALLALLGRGDLALTQEAAIAEACPGISWDSYEVKVVERLCQRDRLPTRALLVAASKIESSTKRLGLLAILAPKRSSREDAAQIAAAATELDWDSYENQILTVLIARTELSVGAALKAAAAISSSTTRKGLYLKLISQRTLTDAQIDAIAEAAIDLDWDSYEKEVLEQLLARTEVSFETVLKMTRAISSGQTRKGLFLKLIVARTLTRAQIDTIADAAIDLDWDRYESEILEQLLARTKVSFETALKMTRAISSGQTRKGLLHRLIKRAPLSAEQVGQIVKATADLDWDAYEKPLVLALIKEENASTSVLIGACNKLASGQLRLEVLLALTRDRGARAADAELIAAVCPELDWDSYEIRLLKALLAKKGLTVEGAFELIAAINSSQERKSLLLGLVNTRALTRAQIDTLAEAATDLDWDSYESEILEQLLARTKVSFETALKMTRAISSGQTRKGLLHRLIKRAPLSAEQVGQIVKATADLDWDAYEKPLVLALIKEENASTSVLIGACNKLASGQLRLEVLLALARDRGDKAADAELIAAVCPELDWDSYEIQLLNALLAKKGLSVKGGVEALGHISATRLRQGLLLALTKRQGLLASEADRIAAACPALDRDSYEEPILMALIGKASRKAIEKALAGISSERKRKEIQAALERAEAKRSTKRRFR